MSNELQFTISIEDVHHDRGAEENALLNLKRELSDLRGVSVHVAHAGEAPANSKALDAATIALIASVTTAATTALFTLLKDWALAHKDQTIEITLPSGFSAKFPRDMNPQVLDEWIAHVHAQAAKKS